MLHTRSLDEALEYLRETPFKAVEEAYRRTGDLKMGELELFREEVSLYTEIEQYVQDEVKEFVRALAMQYEIATLKNSLRLFFKRAVKRESLDDEERYLFREKILYHLPIDDILHARSFSEIPRLLKETPYGQVIEDYLMEVEQEKSLFQLESALDRYYYQELIRRAENLKERDKKVSLRLLGIEIDLYNLNCLIRLKSFYNLPLEKIRTILIPRGFRLTPGMVEQIYNSQDASHVIYGIVRESSPEIEALIENQTIESLSRLALIEEILEQTLVHESRRILSGYPFTIGIILVYFLLKKREISGIQRILNAKQYNLPEDSLMGGI